MGLEKPEAMDGDLLREIQSRSIVRRTGLRIGVNLFFGVMVLALYFGVVPNWMLAAWGVPFVLFQGFSFQKFKAHHSWGRATLNNEEIKRIGYHSGALAAMWSSSLFILGTNGGAVEMLGLWAILLVMMVQVSFVASSMPLWSTIFISITAICGAVSFLLIGSYHLAVAALGVSGLLVAVNVRVARAQVLFEVANGVLQEKSETVSLLLKEFEDSGADWLWQTDNQRCVTHVSPRFAFALGGEARSIDGEPLLKLIAGDGWEKGVYPEALHELADRLKKRESFSYLIVPVTIKGISRWWELSASPRTSEDGKFLGFRGVGSDVTEQRESANKISQLARFDTLTSLPNRLFLTETLNQALSDAGKWRSRCGFLMIDLDRFKAVNDTLGHPVGDRLLAQVAKRLQLIMTDNELCGRLGGDEFAVVVKDASDSRHLATLAHRIIETLSRPYNVDDHTLYIGASVGSAVGPVDGDTVELLMRSADLALYRSKDRGGNTHHNYQHELHANAEEKRLMEFELRNALARKQLHVEYQPVVDATGENSLLGFEALVRWKNPKFGNVSPAKFVPVAEDARLIVPIGDFVLRQACKDAMSWPGDTRIAVNISVDQLTSPNFTDTVVSALHDSGLPAYRLELEVTESIFLRDGGHATQVLDQLRALGIKLSLDDFGTGYSSLGYLRNMVFDTIKIDRSFVQGAARNKSESLAIIRAVVALADSLNIATTAEGVENERELVMIQQLGCKKIQGYFFGRPMVFADACALFQRDARNVA